MLEYDPNDYDLIQAREENLEIINKKINKLKEIQNELLSICPTNPLVKIDIFDYLNKNNQNQQKEQIIKDIGDIYLQCLDS